MEDALSASWPVCERIFGVGKFLLEPVFGFSFLTRDPVENESLLDYVISKSKLYS